MATSNGENLRSQGQQKTLKPSGQKEGFGLCDLFTGPLGQLIGCCVTQGTGLIQKGSSSVFKDMAVVTCMYLET